MSNHKDPFESIETEELTAVSGGAARVASVSGGTDINDQLMAMLTQIGDSIKSLASNNNGGYNRYAFRAGWGAAPSQSGGIIQPSQDPNGTGVSISATEDLPIYANAGDNTNPLFYLARITPTAASGRTLTLNFYDIGDVGNGSVNVQIQGPPDSTTLPLVGGVRLFPTCTFHRDNGGGEQTATNCTIPSMTSATYNGRLVTMTIPVPANYNCDFASSTGCWVKVAMTYTSGAQPNDTTTWTASLNGDPVRLVE